MSKFPISRVCPQCGGKEYTRRAPTGAVAFTDDRVCNVCQTRYTPPTPTWAALVFILIGTLFLAVPVFFIVVLIERPGAGWWFTTEGYVASVMCASLGIGCIVYGIRSLLRSG